MVTTATRDSAAQPDTAPAVGTTVAFCLRPLGEWRPATIIGAIDGKDLEAAEYEDGGRVHLAVKVGKKRHNAARDTVYRLAAPWGAEPGCWLLDAPDGAAAAFRVAEEKRRLKEEVTKEAMREATGRG